MPAHSATIVLGSGRDWSTLHVQKENEMDAKAKGHRPETEDVDDQDSRNRLVRAPKYVDTSIFGGWGIKL
jgi:hypothetical protein